MLGDTERWKAGFRYVLSKIIHLYLAEIFLLFNEKISPHGPQLIWHFGT